MPRSLVTPRLLALLLAPLPVAAAIDGAAIYRQKCADCHGGKGEGVEGKYRDELYGDWALPKLTRYIAKTMPEDDPETLSEAEATAVSRYVFEAFYSREAQQRNRPARIELARLTNRQYASTVADLVGRFVGSGESPVGAGEQRGLNAVYFGAAQRGRFENSHIIHTGLDPKVEFAFAPGSADRERVANLDHFSMQWRGAVRAEETGDYEFVVRTPNSFRFWINRELTPAEASLDINVSRPDDPDHRVTVRLLGGRWYPIAIDYWALPGKVGAPPPAIALRWKPPHGVERPIPARNLAPLKVRPTFVIATRFPPDDSSLGYERSGPVSKAWDEATTSAAFEVANFVTRHLDRLARTQARDPERRRKIGVFLEAFAAAAFRRPLTPEEKARYIGAWLTADGDVEGAARRVVLLVLKSPPFLYTELPADAASNRPPASTIAARLGLGLWDSLPDAALERAAGTPAFATAAGVRAEAVRMLRDDRARAKLREFFHHWLQLRFVEDFAKDPKEFPGFDDELVEDLRTSLDLMLDHAAWGDARADFRQLLRSETIFANRRIAAFYGLPAPAGDEFVALALPDGRRAGVLTHPYVLAAFSYKNSTSPIHRGVFLTRSIAGRALKSPPIAVAFDDTEFTPEMTMREKVVKLTRAENCQGCHAVINPLGFSLEWFDAVGRFRTQEKGRPIDALSEYLTDEGARVQLGTPRDVAEFAIGNEQASQRFVEQLFHHVVKQPVMAFGPDALPRLRESFVASGYNLQTLLVEIATLSARRGLDPALATHSPNAHRP